MVSTTRKKNKNRKSGSLLPEQDQFELDEVTRIIGSAKIRHNSEDEDDIGQRDQVATSTSRLDESDLLNILSR